MKRILFLFVLLFSSVFSLSAQQRLGTTPRIINRADNYYYALDSLFLGEEYSQNLWGIAMITLSAYGNDCCLRTYYDPANKKTGLAYLILDRKKLEKSGKKRVKTYKCPISEEIMLELIDLVSEAVYSSIPGGAFYGADGVTYEFLLGEAYSAECWYPQWRKGSNCDRLVSLFERIQIAVRERDSDRIEDFRPEIKELTAIFKDLRVSINN